MWDFLEAWDEGRSSAGREISWIIVSSDAPNPFESCFLVLLYLFIFLEDNVMPLLHGTL